MLYRVIGVMTGTSMDGVDLVYCHIYFDEDWTYKIVKAACEPIPHDWKTRIHQLPQATVFYFSKGHVDFGKFLGETIKGFISKHHLQNEVDFIASHGQTIFHQPEKGVTVQIGDGADISATCELPVVCNFRTMDVAYGGQGAPIVPIGDKLFFKEYEFCLNIGGITNISFKSEKEIFAYDICPSNLILNELARITGSDYDKDGNIARTGKIDKQLLNEMNGLDFYHKKFPKSLGVEFMNEFFSPLLLKYNISVADKLRTVTEHIAMQVGNEVDYFMEKFNLKKSKMLVTGGGAFNVFLIERIKEFSPAEIIIPNDETVKFKEALVMALIGVLRFRNEVNVLSSVTGASKDTCGGEIFQSITKPFKS
jgi:anhydro-N-acetylmuramic acid kinase